jgi:hypothetical protein
MVNTAPSSIIGAGPGCEAVVNIAPQTILGQVLKIYIERLKEERRTV